MTRTLLWQPRALRYLRRISRVNVRSLLRRAESLCDNPFPKDVELVRGEKGLYRTRVGGYRILYTFNELSVDVVNVDKRGRVYKRRR